MFLRGWVGVAADIVIGSGPVAPNHDISELWPQREAAPDNSILDPPEYPEYPLRLPPPDIPEETRGGHTRL